MLAPALKQCQFCGKEFYKRREQSPSHFAVAKFCSTACFRSAPQPSPRWGELQEKLAALVEQGLSATQIGLEFGASRSAVVSRCIRTGLKLKGGPGGGYKGPRSPRLAKPPKPKKSRPTGPRNVAEDRLIPLEQRKSFMELDDFSCRWPVGENREMFFCGPIREIGQPYCGAHCRRAYRVD